METETSPGAIAQPQVPEISAEIMPKDAQVLAALIGSLVQPLADAQKTASTEATKQAEINADLLRQQAKIEADVQKDFMRVIGGIAFAVIILAAIALFYQKDQMSLSLIMGLFGLLGGLGISKHQKKESDKK